MKNLVEIIHGPLWTMLLGPFFFFFFPSANKKEFITFMYEDPCKDKNIKFLEKKPPILFSQHSSFVNKNNEDCKDQRRRNVP
jgi:hypothetical protein